MEQGLLLATHFSCWCRCCGSALLLVEAGSAAAAVCCCVPVSFFGVERNKAGKLALPNYFTSAYGTKSKKTKNENL